MQPFAWGDEIPRLSPIWGVGHLPDPAEHHTKVTIIEKDDNKPQ